jgi:prevent-host-death family protein
MLVGERQITVVKEIRISEFKAKCSALPKQVNQTKQPLRVTRFGKPVAEVIPAGPPTRQGDWLGSMADTVKITGDIVSPVAEDDWEVLRD